MAGKVVIEASTTHTATIIFFHGLGDTGHNWARYLTEIKPCYIKLVCPTAPTMPVTLISGLIMHSWFDIKGHDPSAGEDAEGIERAATLVASYIEDELKTGIPSSRIMIGGFSQGGALSLYSCLRTAHSLAGVTALSCWLPMRQTFPANMAGNANTPILMCHGDADPVVPHPYGQKSASVLKSFNKSVEFRTYNKLVHSPSDVVLKDVKIFIEKFLPPQ